MSKTIPPPSPKAHRVSVPMDPAVLAVFERLAKAGNRSTGGAIAEWLGDTVEAAQFMAATLEKAREAPKEAIREMHSYALGLSEETGELMERVAQRGKAARAAAGAQRTASASGPLPPRLVIRGGNSPKQGQKHG